MTFKNKVIAGFGAALAILILGAALSYRSMTQSDVDRQWLTHTQVTMEQLDSVLTNMLDIETGERGYVLTGETMYLSPYNNGLQGVRQSLKDLRELTVDNAAQRQAGDLLEPMILERLEIAKDQIELRKHSGVTAGIASVRTGVAKDSMDQIRDQISEMKREERRLLILRTERAAQSSKRTKIEFVCGEVLAIAFLCLAGIVVGKETGHRRRAADQIRTFSAELELRVAERTSELSERAKDLARSNSELQQFAYVASHDLQEPLRMVASFTQLLAQRYGPQLDNDAREFINYAVDGATRMQTLISDLLNYSRVGTQGSHFVPIDCEEVFKKVLEGLQFQTEETGATIEKDILPMVTGDPTQIGQLFQNLLSNALKFRGVEPPRIKISAERNGMVWKISFHDNGIGIKPEHADRIFVIFQRLHTKSEFPGTGIGLAICKKIVERHGGTIWVEPTAGPGTTFCFTIAAAANVNTKGEVKNELRVATRAY